MIFLSMACHAAAFLSLSPGRASLLVHRPGTSSCQFEADTAARVSSFRMGKSVGLQTLRCVEEAPKYRRSGRGNRICILGGGFGGVYTALKLAALAPLEDPKAEITLVDTSER